MPGAGFYGYTHHSVFAVFVTLSVSPFSLLVKSHSFSISSRVLHMVDRCPVTPYGRRQEGGKNRGKESRLTPFIFWMKKPRPRERVTAPSCHYYREEERGLELRTRTSDLAPALPAGLLTHTELLCIKQDTWCLGQARPGVPENSRAAQSCPIGFILDWSHRQWPVRTKCASTSSMACPPAA